LKAFVLVIAESEAVKQVRKTLGDVKGCTIYATEGLFDLIISVETEKKESVSELVRDIRMIPGVKSTLTLMGAPGA
jgi:nitrate reductase NapAB chaperone NapD